MNLQRQPVRDIAVGIPGATGVFRRHKIDFCCNGAAPLAEAAARRGLDPEALEAELRDLTGEADVTAPAETRELIAHILERYHEVHRREFPEAIRMARRVEAVHAGKDDCPHGLGDLLALMFDELEDHQQKEEAILFPMMLSGGGPMLLGPIARMVLEHEELGRQLEDMDRLTDGFTPPDAACTTWRALYAACAKLDEDLREHVHLENNILFPRFL